MSHLSAEAEDLVNAYRMVIRPRAVDRERVLQALLPQLGGSPPAPSPVGPSTGSMVTAKLTLVKSLAVMAGLGLAGGGAYLSLRSERSPETMAVVVAKTPSHATPTIIQEALQTTEAVDPQAEAAKPTLAPSPTTDSLAQEVAILSHASTELHAGRPESALVALAEHQRLFPTGMLTEERTAARVQAFCALGKMKEAKLELTRLAQLFPRSPHEARARKACGFKPSDGE